MKKLLAIGAGIAFAASLLISLSWMVPPLGPGLMRTGMDIAVGSPALGWGWTLIFAFARIALWVPPLVLMVWLVTRLINQAAPGDSQRDR